MKRQVCIAAAMIALTPISAMHAEELSTESAATVYAISDFDQSVAVTNFITRHFPEQQNHEAYFLDPANRIALEIETTLNALPPVYSFNNRPQPKTVSSSAKRSEQANARLAKSLTRELERTRAYLYQANVTANCLYSGSYEIKNDMGSVGIYGQFARLEVSFKQCVDDYNAEFLSIEKNGPVKIGIQFVEGGIAVKAIEFGDAVAPYTETSTHVYSQQLYGVWSANYGVIGDFRPAIDSESQLFVGELAYEISGTINEWHLNGIGTSDRIETNLSAKSVDVQKKYEIQTGVGTNAGANETYYLEDRTFKRGHITFSISYWDAGTTVLSYSFDNLRYSDLKNLTNGSDRYLIVEGGLAYVFPNTTNPVCISGEYRINTPDSLYMTNWGIDPYLVKGTQRLNGNASIKFDVDSNTLEQTIQASIGSQSVTYFPMTTPAPVCF